MFARIMCVFGLHAWVKIVDSRDGCRPIAWQKRACSICGKQQDRVLTIYGGIWNDKAA